MASTIFNCPTCGPYVGGCCPTCAPAQSIFQGECQDPGTLNPGRFLEVLDYKFCRRRLTTGEGLLVSNINGSGNAGLTWSTIPQVQLQDYQATANTTFGQLIVMGADYRWRALNGPASLGLFLQTDAAGNVIFGAPPAATVPDPLAINNLNVAVAETVNDLTTNGTVTLNNLAAGTVVNLLGLDASNHAVLQAITAGAALSMFFESSTSPNAGTPNATKTNGQYLVIGNRLFDSGSNLIAVTTSEALTVNAAGKYLLIWVAQIHTSGAARANVGAWLEINGVIVNQANGRTDFNGGPPNTPMLSHITGFEGRSLAAGDVIKLQLSETATSVETYEVRLVAFKFAD